jgi:ABC-type Mn2+/Zn2+ transport system permease subunit
MTPPLSELLMPAAMAVAAGLVGSIAVMRRMALASDALSHVALPGVAIAILLRWNPLLGGLAALVLGTLLVWALESRTRIPTEAVIGVIFSVALAVGSMLTSGDELINALFGAPASVGAAETIAGVAASVLVIVFVMRARSRLVVALVSPDLARTCGIGVARLDLLFLLAFGLTVALGLRYLGVLLMGSLVIIPAATAMHVARGLGSMQAFAVAIAVGSTIGGAVLAPRVHLAMGPVVITIAAAVFFTSLLIRVRGHEARRVPERSARSRR